MTSGGTEAIFDAVASVVHPGDEVIVLEPCYDSYVPSIELNGGVPVAVPLRLPDYRIDWDAVAAAITPRTRLLMINSPHNPTGSILTAGDIAALTEIVGRTGIYIVSDEVYEHIIFDGATPREHGAPSRAGRPQLRRRLVRQDVSRDRMEGRLRGRAGGADGGAAQGAPVRDVQHAHAGPARASPSSWTARTGLDELPAFFQRKRDLFLRLMQESRFKPLPCRGSYFQLMDYSAISDLPDAEFAIWMTREHGVASIPTSPMLHRSTAPQVVRFCFAKKDETLEQAAERLRGI